MRHIILGCLFGVIGLLPLAGQAQSFNPNQIDGRCPGPFIDTVGDVFPVYGGPMLDMPYGDIAFAWVQPASGYPAMELGMQFVQPLPVYPEADFNGFFFFDRDGDRANNAPDGTRAGADHAVSLMYAAADREWATVVWEYSPLTQEWTGQADPEILYAFDSGGIIIHVPFELMPPDADWPWRAAAALSDGEQTRGDRYPDEEDGLVTCETDGEEPTVIHGAPETPTVGSDTSADGAADGKQASGDSGNEPLPWWVYLWAFLLFGGLITMVGKDLRKRRHGGQAPETPEPSAPPSQPEDEEDPCRCRKCRLFIAVGGRHDRAVSSAANLGKAIKRDTAAAIGLDDDGHCLKVVHFTDSRLTRGRYVRSDSSGDLAWENFHAREVLTADGYGEVCLWQEVIVIHHGERKSKVRRIMNGLRSLIPEKPIQRLVLYYCGGEGTLPQAEFQSLASELGRRLKRIPERCRPSQVDIYLAPTITFGGKEHFTKLVIEQSGLISYQGQMKHYTVDQEGVVTAHGNQVPPGGQIFGEVPLGRLGSNPDLDTQAYRDHWREIAEMPLSEIRRYRQRIEEAGLESPPETPRERQARGYREMLGENRAGEISEAEWDELVDIRSRSAARRWLRQKFGNQLR